MDNEYAESQIDLIAMKSNLSEIIDTFNREMPIKNKMESEDKQQQWKQICNNIEDGTATSIPIEFDGYDTIELYKNHKKGIEPSFF